MSYCINFIKVQGMLHFILNDCCMYERFVKMKTDDKLFFLKFVMVIVIGW